jgi:hypothetical protein
MSLVDELEDPAEPADLSGTAGAAGAAAGAGEISADEAPAKRFKKSAPEAAPEAAAVAPAASSSTAAPADASGWDFEKDLADIFAQTPGEKPRGKAKAKGAQ